MRQAHCFNVSVHGTALYHQLSQVLEINTGRPAFILTSKDIKQPPNHYHHHYLQKSHFNTETSRTVSDKDLSFKYGFMKRKGNRTPCYTFISSFCSRLNDLMTALPTHKKDISVQTDSEDHFKARTRWASVLCLKSYQSLLVSKPATQNQLWPRLNTRSNRT